MTAPVAVSTPAPDRLRVPWRGWLADLAWPIRAATRVEWTGEKVLGLAVAATLILATARWVPQTTWTGVAGVRTATVTLGVLAVLWLVIAAAGRSGGRTAGGESARNVCGSSGVTSRAACGYTAKGEREMHKHEKGHVAACRRAGGGDSSYKVWRNRDGSWSGVTTHHDWRRVARLPVEKRVAILAAGVAAAPSTGSPTDEPHIRDLLAEVPSDRRVSVERRGRALGRRWCR